MSKRSLGYLAVAIILLMGIVSVAGLDDLPRSVRRSVEATSTRVIADQKQLAQQRQEFEGILKQDPALFRALAPTWQSRMTQAGSRIEQAARELAAAQQLVQKNDRADTGRVEEALKRIESARNGALTDASAVRAEAERWLNYKKDLPKQLAAMALAYQTASGFDVEAATAAARKAAADWPAKKADIEGRIDALKQRQAEVEKRWTATARLRAQAEAGATDNLDYGALFAAAEAIRSAPAELQQGAASVNALAGQLYQSWDKLLVEVDDSDTCRQKVRVVRTQYADPSLKDPKVTSDERWEPVAGASCDAVEKQTGLVVERKPAGRYDTEAERAAQSPAYAYVAPPGQSNAYGYWSGGVWNWLPQYLIMRQLLGGGSTISTYDYNRWRGGDRYIGRNPTYSPRSGYSGSGSSMRRALDRLRDLEARTNRGGYGGGSTADRGSYTDRSKPSWGSRGYGGSRYESRGTYSGSRFSTRGYSSGRSFGSRSYSRGFGGGRSFGRGGRR